MRGGHPISVTDNDYLPAVRGHGNRKNRRFDAKSTFAIAIAMMSNATSSPSRPLEYHALRIVLRLQTSLDWDAQRFCLSLDCLHVRSEMCGDLTLSFPCEPAWSLANHSFPNRSRHA